MENVTKFRIPDYDQDPGDDMVSWMNTYPDGTWDGDESGVVVYRTIDGVLNSQIGGPGDFLCGNGTEMWIEDEKGQRPEFSPL